MGQTILNTKLKNHNLDAYKENKIKLKDLDIINLVEKTKTSFKTHVKF